MRNEHWKRDRSDILCPHCRNKCYFKYEGATHRDSFTDEHWRCACCGWVYIEKIFPGGEIETNEPSEPVISRYGYGSVTLNGPYFVFEMLPIEIALQKHPQVGRYDEDFLLGLYLSWMAHFQENAKEFYTRQNVSFLELTFRQFCTEHALDLELNQESFFYFEENGLIKEWRDFESEQGLSAFSETCSQTLEALKYYILKLKYQKQSQSSMTGYDDYLQPQTVFPGFNSVWFKTKVANNSAEEIDQLRHLPYFEYLNTPYWRRIRAAMLMLSDEYRCEICGTKPFSLPTGKINIHVHHKNHRNLGNEQYEDLALICQNCYEKIRNK